MTQNRKKPVKSGNHGRKRKKSSKSGAARFFAFTVVTAGVAIVCALIGYMIIIYNGQKLYEENKDKMVMAEASKIYDVNDNEVAVLSREENRELVTSDQIPVLLKDAFIATEDRRFEKHSGVDLWAIGRALVKDVVSRSAAEGGSTITQQLAKNMFLNADKTFFRKATELSIALALENNLSKDEILTLYLNRIYFGSGAYGVKAAARKYFGVTDLNDLQVWQMATLAGIPKSPRNYSPILNPDKSQDRRAVVLMLMKDQGYITEQQMNEAKKVEYVPPKTNKEQYLTYRDYILQEAEDEYGIDEDKLFRGGYKIYTAMDAKAQRILEQSFENPGLFQKDGPEQKMQGSMVIVNNKDGGIVAMIGGRDYVNKGLNRALVPRQPGSTFKPLVVYGPALETGNYNPYSKLQDQLTSYGNYTPRNYNGVYKGQVDMFEALRLSINAPAVWLLDQIGVNTGRSFVKKLGISLGSDDRNLAIALGGLTNGVTPLQMAQAYSAFANSGMYNKAYAIREIKDSEDQVIMEHKLSPTKAMSPRTAYYMTELLKGVVENGTGKSAKLNRPVAGKTGTTQLDLPGLEKFNRDIWFAGYTPQWTAAVWMGFDKTDRKHYISGSTGRAAVMFHEVMSKAMAKMPVASFKKPDDVPDLKAPPKTASDLAAEYVPESHKVKLTWTGDDTNGIGSYQVFRKSSKDADFTKLMEVKDVFELNDIAIEPGETYQYYVVPYNPESGQLGEKSNTAEVSVPADTAESPGTVDQPEASSTPDGSSDTPAGDVPSDTGGSATASPGQTPEPSGSPDGQQPGASASPDASAKPVDGGAATPTPTVEPASGN